MRLGVIRERCYDAGDAIVDQVGSTRRWIDEAPAHHPVIRIRHDVIGVWSGLGVTQPGKMKILRGQAAVLDQRLRVTRIIDEIICPPPG